MSAVRTSLYMLKARPERNQVGHLMLITQRYTLYHAILYLCECIGHILEKSGEIRVRDSCARKRVEHRV